MRPAENIRLLVTAGPTAEDIDPVRYLTNRSTGQMGMEIIQAALARQWSARLVLGPIPPPPPAVREGLETIRVRSAAQMAQAVEESLGWADALVMAAAVADYTPAEPLEAKLKKTDGDITLRLRRTRDILQMAHRHPARQWALDPLGPPGAKTPLPAGMRPLRAVMGFSLDVDLNEAEGRRKMLHKGLDGIVANTVQSFGADRMQARLLLSDGRCIPLEQSAKAEVAQAVIDQVDAILRRQGRPGIDI